MADSIFVFGAKYLYLLAFVVAAIWLVRLPAEKRKGALIFAAVALPAIFIASRIASWLYLDPRPFVVGHFTPLVPHAADNGFPSDHTLLVSAIASIIFPFDRKTSVFVWIVAALVGISRVYVGIHHLIDIVGSVVISIAMSAIVYWALRKFNVVR